MLFAPRENLSFPAGRSPGVDYSHVSLRAGTIIRCSCVVLGGSMVELQTATPAALFGSAAVDVSGAIGPGIKATAVGDYCKFTGLTRARTTTENAVTLAAIFRHDNTANARINAVATSSVLNKGYALGTRNNFVYLAMPGQNEADVTTLPLVAGHCYFLAWSPGSSAGPVVLVDFTTGQISLATVALANALFPTDGSFTVGASPSTSSGQGVGSVAAACLINRSLSPREMLAWAQDPWAFWYPRVEPEFYVGGLAAAALAALTRIVARGRVGFSGTTPIAARASAQVKARPALAGSVALSGRSMVETMARASIAGASALAGRAAAAVKARASIAGSVALAGRTMIETMGRVIPPGAIALFARAAVSVATRAAGPLASTALAGRTVLRVSGRIVPPGAIALVAAAFARLTGRAQAAGAAGLSGNARLQGRSVLTLTPTAQLAAKTNIAGRGRTGLSASLALAAAARIAARGRGALSAGAALAALAGRTSIRSAARAILTRLGVPFTASPRNVMPPALPRNVMPPALPRSVQVAGESRVVTAIDDGRSAEPGSS